MGWKRSKGFSLVELLITVAIVGIIAAIAYPSYQSSVRQGRRGDAISTLLALQLAQERHRAMNVNYQNNINDPIFALNAGATSFNGFYTIALANVTAGTFRFTATPVGDQLGDTCGAFQLDQNGPVIGFNGQPATCWSP